MMMRGASVVLGTVLIAACATPVADRVAEPKVPGPARVTLERTLGAICAIDGPVAGLECTYPAPSSVARNAMIEVNSNADIIADRLDATPSLGPLHGVPVALKDNIETGDWMRTTAGSLALINHRAARDAHLVTRLRDAGVVIVGKTNLSEWANFRSTQSVSGWSSVGGQTRHALDPARNPCGSSSGSAVAVATGIVPLAVGTETDGSIICPASINGIVGIKPTLGLVSRSGIVPLSLSQDTAGPMARDVKSAALLLAAMAGTDPDDAATQRIPEGLLPLTPDFRDDALAGKRIGVLRSYGGAGNVPAVEAAYTRSLARLEAAGAVLVDPIEIDTTGMGAAEYTVLLHEFRDDLNAYLEARLMIPDSLAELIAFNEANADAVMPHFGQEIFLAAEATGGRAAPEYAEALARSKSISRGGLDGAFDTHELDAIVAPSNGPAWPTDYENGDGFSVGSSSLAAVSGYPSITVPAGAADGLPLGLSFIGREWHDREIVEFAFAFEQVRKD
ncbi:MAG: amidase [Pseudomonadota bacterium]